MPHSKMVSKFKATLQSINQERSFCRKVCRQDRMDFESNSAASRNGSQTGRITPARGSLICTLDPVGTCLCWKTLLFVPVLLPDLCSHVPTQGEICPMEVNSQAHSANIHTAINTRALGLPSGSGDSTRREGTVRQEVSITVNALPELQKKSSPPNHCF